MVCGLLRFWYVVLQPCVHFPPPLQQFLREPVERASAQLELWHDQLRYEAKQPSEHTVIKRQILEYELERINASTRTTDSSTPQASTHRSLLVNCVHMPPAGPMDTERGMGGWGVHRDQEDASDSAQTYSRPPDIQAYENRELRPGTYM